VKVQRLFMPWEVIEVELMAVFPSKDCEERRPEPAPETRGIFLSQFAARAIIWP